MRTCCLTTKFVYQLGSSTYIITTTTFESEKYQAFYHYIATLDMIKYVIYIDKDIRENKP